MKENTDKFREFSFNPFIFPSKQGQWYAQEIAWMVGQLFILNLRLSKSIESASGELNREHFEKILLS